MTAKVTFYGLCSSSWSSIGCLQTPLKATDQISLGNTHTHTHIHTHTHHKYAKPK